MLSGTKNRRGLLQGVSVMTFALSFVCLLLTALFVQSRPDGISALSRQDMKTIVGGEGTETCTECDDCHTVSRTLLECAHYNTGNNSIPTTCNEKGCFRLVLLSKSCSHSQGPGAEGCDTKESTQDLLTFYGYVPKSFTAYETAPAMDETCVLKNPGPNEGDWFVWIKLWYGCDTGPDKECHFDQENAGTAACEAASCTMTDLDFDEPRGKAYECGC